MGCGGVLVREGIKKDDKWSLKVYMMFASNFLSANCLLNIQRVLYGKLPLNTMVYHHLSNKQSSLK